MDTLRTLGNQAAELSNKVGTGEYGFIESLRMLISAYRKEVSIGSLSEIPGDNAFWKEQIDRTQKAIDIYEKAIQSAEQDAIVLMRSQGLYEYAEALESGDTSSLAY